MDIISLIPTIVLVITVVITGAQTYLLRKQVKAEHEWKRREKALSFSKIYNESLRESQLKISNAFGYIQSRELPLTPDEIKQAFDKDPTLRDDVSFFLAYLENIGLAVRHHIANFEIIYDLMANTYLKYYFLFQLHIRKAKEHNPRLWENIEFLANELEDERRRRREKPVRLPRADK